MPSRPAPPARPAHMRRLLSVLVLAAAALAIPVSALAVTVGELVKLAESSPYFMNCTAGAASQVCVHPDYGWRAVIQPGSGDVDQLLTEDADNDPPLDTNAQAWMADMHETACGDPKGVSGFVADVARMTQFDKTREIKATIGICDFVGGLYGGQLQPLTYRIVSTVNAPAPTPTPRPSPSPTPRPTVQPTASPRPASSPGPAGPTPTSGASGAASIAPAGTTGPSGPASAAPTADPSPDGSGAPTPSPDVAGVESGPPDSAGPAPGSSDAPGGPAAPAPDPPTFDQSVLGVSEVNTDGGAIGGSLLLALLMLLIIGFAGELFNNTVENNYSEISSWLRKRPLRWLREAGGRIVGEARIGIVAFLFLTALISSFVDPYFGLDLRSVAVFLGFLVGLVVVLASFKLPPMVAHRRTTGELGTLRPLPWALGIAIVFVLVSRITNLQPGYLYGIVLGVLFVREVSPKEEGRETFFGSVWTLVAAVGGWLGLTWLRGLGLDPDGFAMTLLATACAAVMVGGLEATAFGLMPMRFMQGYAVYKWNRLAWALLWGLSLFGFVHILIAPAAGYVSELSPEAFAAALGVFAAFGALSLAVWGYFRFRGPVAAPAGVPLD